MSTEEQLKDIILSKYGTVKDFAKVCELPYGTVDTILRRGVRKASITNIIRICKTLHISTDELAHDRIVFINDMKSRNEPLELRNLISQFRKNKSELSGLLLNGTALTECELDFLLDGLEMTTEILIRNRSRIQANGGTEQCGL